MDADADDADCVNGYDNSEAAGDDGTCSDSLDNDADGWTDLDDPECWRPDGIEYGHGLAACNDGVDNDGDMLVDADDAGCLDAQDPLETDPSAF